MLPGLFPFPGRSVVFIFVTTQHFPFSGLFYSVVSFDLPHLIFYKVKEKGYTKLKMGGRITL